MAMRNPDDQVEREPQVRVPATVRSELTDSSPEEDLFTSIRKRVEGFGGVELEIPPREFSTREVVSFD